jgi:hypothetical protein
MAVEAAETTEPPGAADLLHTKTGKRRNEWYGPREGMANDDVSRSVGGRDRGDGTGPLFTFLGS